MLLRSISSKSCHRKRAAKLKPGKKLAIESLETRLVLTTTLYLDFGAGIGFTSGNQNTLSSTVGAVRNIDGTGIHGDGTGPDLQGQGPIGSGGMLSTSSLDFRPLSYDFDGDSNIDGDDLTALADAVVPIVERALQPFDIDVAVVAATSLADIVNTLNANNAATDGQHDAYSFIVDTVSDFFGGGSVGDSAGPGGAAGADLTLDGAGVFGIAAADDLFDQSGNNQDEVALIFADTILDFTSGALGTAAFNVNLAHRIAYTATHEAFHTFSLRHTTPDDDDTPQGLMSNGDVIKFGATPDARENPFIVTRFDLQHDTTVAEPNNYNLTANDTDIGLRDDDDDGVPNLAYVTGTGGFDHIQLALDPNDSDIVDVTVTAYSNAAFDGNGNLTFNPANLIQRETYQIDLTADTEGEILIDSSLSHDLIEIDADIAADFRIRTQLGDDQVRIIGNGGSAYRSLVYQGEDGDDLFTLDFQDGDVLALTGGDFNFVGGPGDDDAVVIEADGSQHVAYFANTFSDAVDVNVGDGRADSVADNPGIPASLDDQTTLRAAIQEANASGNGTYVFLPLGSFSAQGEYVVPDSATYELTLSGGGGDTQGDLDITKNTTVIGTGAGETVIDASGLSTADRIFEVYSGVTLDLSGVTLTGGGGSGPGAILVRGGGHLNLDRAALVGNTVFGSGGAISINNGGSATITNSVITDNTAQWGGGIFVAPLAGPVLVGTTLVANNQAANGGNDGDDLYSSVNGGNVGEFTSLGNNRITNLNAAVGFTHDVMGDHIGSVNYVVTGVADIVNTANDAIVRSLREAVMAANLATAA